MIVVFAFVVGIVALPYIFFILFGSSNTKKIHAKFKEEASKNDLSLAQSETWNGRQIAIDTIKNVLLYGRIVQDKLIFEYIDLAQISQVNIFEDSKTKRIDGKVITTLENLALTFTPQGNGTPVTLNFYDSLFDASQNFELKRATQWKNTIAQQLHIKSAHHVAA
ncbi:hypothetical protein SAMN02745246_00450 [Leeuwenhoekiella marinoflava DSM 3653]|uniref:Uncharacterized protein n=3 Tax=Leeuwenhoekiella marinoflava TaxID=988 RepID=A0A4Q0PRT0_9FLAO|nr:hypothetical protein DSL99_391 [Leeuwenhoekiella marinoflava]SHE50811.1 hypothetical protein SAMN02745246_00450 [Leeuwenhoekiella marinoflava DSM 3653]